jgi:hypothetical protein
MPSYVGCPYPSSTGLAHNDGYRQSPPEDRWELPACTASCAINEGVFLALS